MRILGIDYGHVRMGIALSDLNGFLAKSLDYINRKKGGTIQKIKDLVIKYNCKEIVLGLPISLNGNETQKTKEVQNFKKRLEKEIKIPIKYHNEALTTYEAYKILDKLKIRNKEKRKRKKDSLSAQVILQEYLNENQSTF